MDGWTDGRTNGWMDTASYRDVRTHLKIKGHTANNDDDNDNDNNNNRNAWLKQTAK